jgi:hypothetical protein
MAKERPIIFSTPMVQAILQGRKTQTRRVVKFLMPNDEFQSLNQEKSKAHFYDTENDDHRYLNCPYGQPGDLLWVRETWAKNEQDGVIDFRADYASQEHFYGWKPSIHMPKDAARIWLKLTEVRVERLHDISEIDAAREGLLNSTIDADRTAKLWFYNLWKSIHGPGSLEKNPWVWVLSFEVVSTLGRKEATNG